MVCVSVVGGLCVDGVEVEGGANPKTSFQEVRRFAHIMQTEADGHSIVRTKLIFASMLPTSTVDDESVN